MHWVLQWIPSPCGQPRLQYFLQVRTVSYPDHGISVRSGSGISVGSGSRHVGKIRSRFFWSDTDPLFLWSRIRIPVDSIDVHIAYRYWTLVGELFFCGFPSLIKILIYACTIVTKWKVKKYWMLMLIIRLRCTGCDVEQSANVVNQLVSSFQPLIQAIQVFL